MNDYVLQEEEMLPEDPEDPEEPEITEPEEIGYVSLSEALDYINGHIVDKDTLEKWGELESQGQAALLRRAFELIELLPFTGHKNDSAQPTTFPRCPMDEVPWQIKAAQIEQAMMWLDPDDAEEAENYEKMTQWGVSSYTIGNFSESLRAPRYRSFLLDAGITSLAAARLLKPFLSGGYNIR